MADSTTLAPRGAINDNGAMSELTDTTAPTLDCPRLAAEAAQLAASEPLLADVIARLFVAQTTPATLLATLISERIRHRSVAADALFSAALNCFEQPQASAAAAADLEAIYQRDSACQSRLQALLFSKGFLALQGYRVAHALWRDGQRNAALLLQHTISCQLAVDIHPAAVIGSGVMFDHATGVVIGETARVSDNVSIMQGVTLGGTGKESGDRHPKVGRGVLLGPGAKILGNIEIGCGAMVAAAAVVLKPVAANSVVAGVPAQAVGRTDCDNPAELMDHYFHSAEQKNLERQR